MWDKESLIFYHWTVPHYEWGVVALYDIIVLNRLVFIISEFWKFVGRNYCFNLLVPVELCSFTDLNNINTLNSEPESLFINWTLYNVLHLVVTNHLYLLDEPGVPGKPLVMDWDKDHVDLEWPAPKSDGGSPITGYIIQKKEKGSPYWVNAVHVPPKQTSVSVKSDIITSKV